MKEESKKFPAVMTLQGLCGIEEGTVLRFDWGSGKYVSIMEEEELAEDYYYSGYAIALDPYVVKDNIGTVFTYIEQESEPTKEEVKPEPASEVKQPDPVAPEGVTFSEYTKTNAFVVDCSCGHRQLLGTVNSPGLNFTIMAEDETSCIELTCGECGASLKLWLDSDENPERDLANELTE